MSYTVYIPRPADEWLASRSRTSTTASQVLITMDEERTMVLSQRTGNPLLFGTLADLWELQVADTHGEWDEGVFVTAFRQGDLLILRQVNGDKRVTIDFSAEHAYVDHGDGAVESFDTMEVVDGDEHGEITAWDALHPFRL